MLVFCFLVVIALNEWWCCWGLGNADWKADRWYCCYWLWWLWFLRCDWWVWVRVGRSTDSFSRIDGCYWLVVDGVVYFMSWLVMTGVWSCNVLKGSKFTSLVGRHWPYKLGAFPSMVHSQAGCCMLHLQFTNLHFGQWAQRETETASARLVGECFVLPATDQPKLLSLGI